jgi:hypothetical protein
LIHKNIYSKRIKNIQEYDTYEYEIDDELKINSFMILFSKCSNIFFIGDALKDFCETKRVYISHDIEQIILFQYNYTNDDIIKDLKRLIEEYTTEDILDFIDITIANINNKIIELKDNKFEYSPIYDYSQRIKKIEELKELKEIYISEVNEVFEHNNLGFEVINDVIVTKKSDFMHQEVVVKSLTLLVNEEFDGALEEFKNAIESYTKAKYENTIIEACKAFESTMKSILDKLGVSYEKNKVTANDLLGLLKVNGLFDPFLDNMFKNLQEILRSGLPTVRNKISGHGDGIDVVEVKRSYASFALNLSGSSIVFLLDRYYEKLS